MKKMFLISIFLITAMCFSCSSYDDAKIKKEPITKKDDPSQEQPSSEPTSTETEEEITISTDTNDVSMGDSVEYSAHISTGKNITTMSKWSSSDESILQSEGRGVFNAVGAGDVDITVKYKETSATIKVHVYARPTIIEGGERYSSMIWGLENCASNGVESWSDASYKIGDRTLYCNGDCDDAWLSILGEDITLVTYQDKLYLIANKDQTVSFTTFIRSYGEWQGGVNINTARTNLNSNSKLNVYIKDKDDKVFSSEELTIFPKENVDNLNLAMRSIKVHKGDRIDFRTHLEGTLITSGACPDTVEFSTIKTIKTSTSEQAGYWLTNDGTSIIGHRTIKIKN